MNKKLIALFLAFSLLFTLCSCNSEEKEEKNTDEQIKYRGEYSKDLAGSTLNVYNWGEYISDGSDDSLDVNAEFEKLTGIKVNYTTYESNETMYSQIKSGGVSYDIIIPSDYMIERMINEDMLSQIDVGKISNYDLIDKQYKGLFFDKNEKFTVPYNVGMVGVIYNKALIGEPEKSWKSLWNEKYKDMSLNFGNPRDAFMTAQMILGQDLNTTDKKDWEAAAELLKKQKPVLQSYVMDEIFGKMETGEAAIAPYYAGDFLLMNEINPDLGFYYPEEGTNIFIDSICIPKNVKHYEAAMMYINFLLEPGTSLANAEYIGYASPNTSVVNNPEYCYYQDEILYPEEFPENIQYYHDMDDETRMYYENLWIDVKLY
ncbi:MAG: spermidine/putrescine ABC transporter substrate-binding protein [Oscillospiraceae bacterium]|nr:spermidine/putrescine ABC transporter substrate-binding protein [Candidatus Equicaccousia limihippi]